MGFRERWRHPLLARAFTATLSGIESGPVVVEVDVHSGLPSLDIVGLAGAGVREARDRVRGAVRNAGWTVPPRRITVNLAPGHVRKAGSHYDLPIALSLLQATGQARGTRAGWWAAGELALDGSLLPTPGILPIALAARSAGARHLLVPSGNGREASAVPGLDVVPLRSLADAVAWLEGGRPSAAAMDESGPGGAPAGPGPRGEPPDFLDVRGQAHAKRALLVAAAGGHNVLLVGPPGCGKTMLATRLPGILPDLDEATSFEVTAVHSAAGLLPAGSGLIRRPPFRAPSPGVTQAALLGGGTHPRPGEISLAHGGVLFIDEMARHPVALLESLRAPLEDGHVVVARHEGAVRYPARAQLVLADNPCPCGWHGVARARRACRCREDRILRYRGRLSGPLRDRVDIELRLALPPFESLGGRPDLGTEEMRRMVLAAHRFRKERGQAVPTNRLAGDALEEHAGRTAAAERLLARVCAARALGPRGRVRLLRLARTIADLEASERVGTAHVAEAANLHAPLEGES